MPVGILLKTSNASTTPIGMGEALFAELGWWIFRLAEGKHPASRTVLFGSQVGACRSSRGNADPLKKHVFRISHLSSGPDMRAGSHLRILVNQDASESLLAFNPNPRRSSTSSLDARQLLFHPFPQRRPRPLVYRPITPLGQDHHGPPVTGKMTIDEKLSQRSQNVRYC